MKMLLSTGLPVLLLAASVATADPCNKRLGWCKDDEHCTWDYYTGEQSGFCENTPEGGVPQDRTMTLEQCTAKCTPHTECYHIVYNENTKYCKIVFSQTCDFQAVSSGYYYTYDVQTCSSDSTNAPATTQPFSGRCNGRWGHCNTEFKCVIKWSQGYESYYCPGYSGSPPSADRELTLEQCQKKCTDTPRCYYFTYNENTRYCATLLDSDCDLEPSDSSSGFMTYDTMYCGAAGSDVGSNTPAPTTSMSASCWPLCTPSEQQSCWPDCDDDDDAGLSGGAIAAIVILPLFFGFTVVCFRIWCYASIISSYNSRRVTRVQQTTVVVTGGGSEMNQPLNATTNSAPPPPYPQAVNPAYSAPASGAPGAATGATGTWGGAPGAFVPSPGAGTTTAPTTATSAPQAWNGGWKSA